MKRYFVGLDVSKDETAVCLRDDRGAIVTSFKKPTDPDLISRALSAEMEHIVCVVLETGRMANWLYDELSQRGLPMVCIDARQAHAVLSQMHNKTDENDAAMLSELARTGFYKKIEVKSRLAQERRALLRAREVAVKMSMNTENTIRGLLASFGIRLPKHLQTYEQRVRKVLEGQTEPPRVSERLLCSKPKRLFQGFSFFRRIPPPLPAAADDRWHCVAAHCYTS